ncbi:MAG: hypothetical protein CV088_05310 [Nitrospira sp. LK70]|nr:hypothetical protein [Nitrospira sp. LK70]
MGERVIKGYQRLFEIRLLHHYWLDEGATLFDLLSDQAAKDSRLLTYDARPFLRITPTAATSRTLDGFGGFFKATALGCIVAVPSSAVIPADGTLEFIVTVQSQDLLNYTALTLRPCRIYDLYHQMEKKLYRYKENVPVLSNLTGTVRGAGPTRTLFLSKEIPAPAADDQVEALVVSGGALVQLTGDQPGAGMQQVGAVATDLPVFVHQGDAPAIVPSAGLVGAPARGVLLTDDLPESVFALIRLTPVRADVGDFSFIDAGGHAKLPHPVYHVRFKNRSTTWRYVNKQTRAVISMETTPFPLTWFGNAGTKQKPSDGFVKAEKSGDRIARLVSEIYV